MKLMESSIPTNYTINLKAEQCNWQPTNTFKMYDTIFRTMAEVVALQRKQDGKTSATIRDIKGNLLLACILEWNEPEEEGQVDGNWTLVFTQDEADLEGASQFNVSDTQFSMMFTNIGVEMYNMRISDALFITKYVTLAINTLLENLRVNAKAGEEYIVEEDDFFMAKSSIEDGEVVIGIVPGDKLKELIKNDGTTANK